MAFGARGNKVALTRVGSAYPVPQKREEQDRVS